MAVRSRKSTEERREEIARAVLRIIGERGLPALTTASLAAEVGLSTGALFKHFASRDEMLREAARHAVRRMEGTFPDAGRPPLERILGLARARLEVLGTDPGLSWIVRSEQAWLTLPAPAVADLRRLVARTRRFLVGALRDGIAEGSVRDDVEPEVLLVPVIGTIHALLGSAGAHRFAAGRKGGAPERVLEALVRLISPPKE